MPGMAQTASTAFSTAASSRRTSRAASPCIFAAAASPYSRLALAGGSRPGLTMRAVILILAVNLKMGRWCSRGKPSGPTDRRFSKGWSSRTSAGTNSIGVGRGLSTVGKHGKCCGRFTTSVRVNDQNSSSSHEWAVRRLLVPRLFAGLRFCDRSPPWLRSSSPLLSKRHTRWRVRSDANSAEVTRYVDQCVPVKLEKVPMEMLILLLEKDGHLVTRQQIIERLWGNDVFVDTEHGINTAIRKIRQALTDDSDQPRFVQTVKGKGYRFVAAVANVENGRSSRLPASQRMWDRKPEHSVRIAWMAARFQSHRCSAPLVAFRQRRCAILFSGLLSSSFWHY